MSYSDAVKNTLDSSFDEFPKGAVRRTREEILADLPVVAAPEVQEEALAESSFDEFPVGAIRRTREEILADLPVVAAPEVQEEALAESSFDEFPVGAIRRTREEILENLSFDRFPVGAVRVANNRGAFPAPSFDELINRTINLGAETSPKKSGELPREALRESAHFPPLPAAPRGLNTSTPLSSPTVSPTPSPDVSPIKKVTPRKTGKHVLQKLADPKKAKQDNAKKRRQAEKREKEEKRREREEARLREIAEEKERLAQEEKRIEARLKYGAGPKRVKKAKKTVEDGETSMGAKKRKAAEESAEAKKARMDDEEATGMSEEDVEMSEEEEEESKSEDESVEEDEFVHKDHFPTPKEMRYFNENTQLSVAPRLKRENNLYVSLNPTVIRFTGLDKPENAKNLPLHVSRIIDIFIRRMIELAGGNLKTTKYWLKFEHEGYNESDGFHVNHKAYPFYDGQVVFNLIANHEQSENSRIRLDDNFRITMNVFAEKWVSGKGRVTEKIRNELMETYFGPKNNRVVGDSHCLPKALALGRIKFAQKVATTDAERYKLIKRLFNLTGRSSLKNRESKQLELAKKLLKEAKMNVNQKEHNREDLKQLAAHLCDYQIHLWSAEDAVPTLVEVFNPGAMKFIGLLHHDNHYEYVTSMKVPRQMSFCAKCGKFSDSNHVKKCTAKCQRCGGFDCQPGNEAIYCPDCNIYFRSQKCYDGHLTRTRRSDSLPYCDKYFYCKKCLMIDRRDTFRGSKHIHYAKNFCYICRQKAPAGHKCTHPLPTEKTKERMREAQKKWRVVVYDMECVVAESGEYRGNATRGPHHQPNLICVRMFCSDCRGADGCDLCKKPWAYSYEDDVSKEVNMEEEDSRKKDNSINEEEEEGKSEDESDEEEEEFSPSPSAPHIIQQQYTPAARFARFLMKSPRANGAYVIAHNGGRYDHALLLSEMDREGGPAALTPKVILRGNTIISAEFKYKKQKLHLRDSMQYLVMALSKMPGAFGLTGEAKGFFPHLYNHPDNYDKVLATLPPIEYYSPDFMRPEMKAEFEEWHEEHYDDGFVLGKELLKYCESDVRILTLTMIAFIEKCEEIFNGWNPIVNGCTLASYVFFVLKHEYIKEGDVGYVPENGFGGGQNSKIALKYLQWLEKKTPGLHLQYALKGGEKQVKANGRNYSLDGYNVVTNEVYEVHGCLWHGCARCHTIRDKKQAMCGWETPQVLYDRTVRREEDLRNEGFTLHVVWECEIRSMLEKDSEMRKFFELNKYTRNLMPRDALYGGRTQAFQSMVESGGGQQLEYYDFNSMYPYLNAIGAAYPRGNPEVITFGVPKADQPLNKRGLVYCDVLPAISAPMGILPCKIAKKLMFPLCRSCAEEQRLDTQCPHRQVSERFLTGVWTTDELEKAISAGYKVLKYHEIWHWNDWVKGGFFADYIRPLLKIKHESSGWPKDDMTDLEKKEHIENIFEKDGVELDAANVKKNKALRSLSKIFLNSAWGKFAQNPSKPETILILKSDCVRMANFFNDPNYEPVNMMDFGEHKLWLSRKPKEETVKAAPFTNLAIAAITTSAARLRLTEAIEKVGVENMIYCDTDSLMFAQKTGEDPLKDLKGQQLGALADEIPQGSKLVGVVSMAPKVYAMKVLQEDGSFSYTVKVKGMTMNAINTQKITYGAMKKAMTEFIKNGTTEPLEGEMIRFMRGKHAFSEIQTGVLKKILRPIMDKGHFEDGVSLPFGLLPQGTLIVNDYPF